MNYKIGDIVYRKNENANPKYAKKYIFLGVTEDTDLCVVRIVSQTTGGNVKIGVFINEPVVVKTSDDSEYFVETFLYDVDLFEKVENLNGSS